jgi:hypothetical protein
MVAKVSEELTSERMKITSLLAKRTCIGSTAIRAAAARALRASPSSSRAWVKNTSGISDDRARLYQPWKSVKYTVRR